jgi:hypothetical protein
VVILGRRQKKLFSTAASQLGRGAGLPAKGQLLQTMRQVPIQLAKTRYQIAFMPLAAGNLAPLRRIRDPLSRAMPQTAGVTGEAPQQSRAARKRPPTRNDP